MKHAQLHAIAHNFADSLASGLGFVVGYLETDVFADATRSPGGVLIVDFLSGQVDDGIASDQLRRALLVYRDAFDGFCRKHGAAKSDFSEFRTRFEAGRRGNVYSVTITDLRGRRSTIDYSGVPGRRIKMRDDQGRIVPVKSVHSR